MSGITICVKDTSKMTIEDMFMFIEAANSEKQEADLIKEFDDLRTQYMKDLEELRNKYEVPMRNILSKIQQVRSV